MKWKIYTALAGFVIFGVPIILFNMGVLSHAAKWERLLTGDTYVPEAIEQAGNPVLDAWGNFREGREIDALFVPDNFTRKRSIRNNYRVSIDDLLAEGEVAPAPEFERLWVTARAPQWVRNLECPAVLASFGRSCAISTVEVDDTKEPGIYDLDAVIGYLPDEPLGSTAIEGPRDLIRARIRLPERGGLDAMPEQANDVKVALYIELKQACAEVRSARGNCAVADVAFRSDRQNSDGSRSYYVYANLYSVAPKGTRGEQEDLVGSYEDSFAANEATIRKELGLLERVSSFLGLGGSEQTASRGDGPRIIRGGHNRYGGSDGRFIPARDR